MLNIAVCVSGGGTVLQAIIDACEAGKINGQIRLVISNRKKAYGLERARLHGIQAEWIKEEDEILKRFEEEKFDVVVLAGYLAIVGDKLIEQYKNRIINIHPSLIPSFCGPGFYGRHVHEAVFKRGVKVSGETVHFVTGEVDGGPIILQRAVVISDLETPEDIQARVLEIEHEILPEAVALYCEGRVSVENERVKIS